MSREALLRRLSISLSHLAESSDEKLNRQLEDLRKALRDVLDEAELSRISSSLAKHLMLQEEESRTRPGDSLGDFATEFAQDIKALPVDKNHRAAMTRLADQLLGREDMAGQLETLREVFKLLQSAGTHAPTKKSSSGGLLGWLDRNAETENRELEGLLEKTTRLLEQALQHIDVLNGNTTGTSGLREQLDQSTPIDSVDEAVEQVITMLRHHNDRIEQERATTQSFLDGLRKRLNQVEDVIHSVVSDGDESLDRALTLEQQVGGDVRDIGHAVREDNLDVLKAAVDKGLSSLSAKLVDYLSVEKHSHEQTRRKVTDLSRKIQEMESESRHLRGQIKERQDLAVKDALTGVYNRAGLEERMNEEFARVARSHAPLSLVFVDCNKFKRINDNFGHSAGDTVLVKVASTLTGRSRKSDIVARYGGDEFVVVLPDTPLDGASHFARDACQKVLDAGFHANGQPLDVSISCGITQVRAADTPETALNRADEAMYDAKKTTGLRVVAIE